MAAAQFPTYPGLKGRVVLITGAGHGIGAAVARAFAAQKARVAINYHRSARAAAALAAGLARKGCKAAAYGADASNPLDISATIMRVRKDLGPVSILVNNASLMLLRRPFDRRTWPDFQAELDVALKGAILCAQAVLPDMRKARAGAIVNIITTLTERPVPGFTPHISAKSALLGFTRALAVELGPLGVAVNAVSPGYVLSGLTAKMPPDSLKRLAEASPTGRLSRPEDVAAAVLFLAASPQITGQCLTVDGGLSLAG